MKLLNSKKKIPTYSELFAQISEALPVYLNTTHTRYTPMSYQQIGNTILNLQPMPNTSIINMNKEELINTSKIMRTNHVDKKNTGCK